MTYRYNADFQKGIILILPLEHYFN